MPIAVCPSRFLASARAASALPSGVCSGLIADACVVATSSGSFAVGTTDGGALDTVGDPPGVRSGRSGVAVARAVPPFAPSGPDDVDVTSSLSFSFSRDEGGEGDGGDDTDASPGAVLDDFPPPCSGSLTASSIPARDEPGSQRVADQMKVVEMVAGTDAAESADM